jgi:hypothetical protein
MESETIEEIKNLTGQLAKLVVSIEPVTPAEWECMEKLQSAHKQLRGIDMTELVEQPKRAEFTR